MNKLISIRNAKFAKLGLIDLINYINLNSEISTKEQIMLEVGCYVGDSTKIFRGSFKEVTSVDPFVNGYDDNDASSFTHPMSIIEKQFRETILEPFGNVHLLKMSSSEASKLYTDNQFHFIYLDGNHTKEFLTEDVKNWLPKVKEGFWLGGHDYNNKNAPEVKGVIDSIFGKPDQIFKDTSWIKRI